MEKREVIISAFTWLFIGLFVSFIVSLISVHIPIIRETLFGAFNGLGAILYFIIDILAVFILATLLYRLTPLMAKVLFILKTAFTGFSLTGIFIYYTDISISLVFLTVSIIFGLIALIEKNYEIELSKWSEYAFATLLLLLILEMLNMSIFHGSLTMIICAIAIIVFIFYSSRDIQNTIDQTYLRDCENKGIYCAFQLFLNFINLFRYIIIMIGNKRD